jgi:hypothetical protein
MMVIILIMVRTPRKRAQVVVLFMWRGSVRAGNVRKGCTGNFLGKPHYLSLFRLFYYLASGFGAL